MLKKTLKISLCMLFIACTTLNFSNIKIPRNLLTSLKFNFRSIAQSSSQAFLDLRNTQERLEHMENVLFPLITKETQFIIDKASEPYSVSDIMEQVKKASKASDESCVSEEVCDDNQFSPTPTINELRINLNRLIQQAFIVKYEILWLVKNKIKKLSLDEFSGYYDEDNGVSATDAFDSNNFLVKMQKQYLGILSGIHYLYLLVAHVQDEESPGKVYDFDFSVLQGLNLITSKYYIASLQSSSGQNLKRITPPSYSSNIDKKLFTNLDPNLKKEIDKTFSRKGDKVLSQHFNEYKNFYIGLDGEYANRISSIKLTTDDYIPNLVSHSIGDEEKYLLEYLVLKKPKNQRQFAKLTQFLGTREIMVNGWAVQRLLGGQKNEKVNDCVKGCLSFKGTGARKGTKDISYNRSLWRNDFYLNRLNKISDRLQNLIYKQSFLGNSKEILEEGRKISEETSQNDAAVKYQAMILNLILDYENIGSVPKKLKNIIESNFSDYRISDDPALDFSSFYPIEDSLTSEVNTLNLESVNFMKSVFSEDNLSPKSISSLYSLEAYSMRKKSLVHYFLSVFTDPLFLEERYSDDYDFEITRKDRSKIESFLEQYVEKVLGEDYLNITYKKIYSIVNEFYDDLYKDNYNQKLDNLHLFLTENVKKSFLLEQYFNQNNRSRKQRRSLLNGESLDSVPESMKLPLTQYTNIGTVILQNYFYVESPKLKKIFSQLFKTSKGIQILQDLNLLIFNKYSNDSFFKKISFENFDQINEFEVSDNLWRIFKESIIELNKKYPYSVKKYNFVLENSKYGNITEYEDDVVKPIDACSSVSECVSSMGNSSAGKPEEAPELFKHYDSGFIVHYIADIFNFLDFNMNKKNQFVHYPPVQEVLSSIYLKSLVENEPFFKSRVFIPKRDRQSLASKALAERAGREPPESTFKKRVLIDLLKEKILRSKTVPSKDQLKTYLDQVITSSKVLSNDKNLQMFCKADFNDYDKSSGDFKEVFLKTKNIREVIIEGDSKFLKKIDNDLRWNITPIRYGYEKTMGYMVWILVGLFLAISLSALPFTAALGAGILSVFQSSLFLGSTGIIFLMVGIYEINYGVSELLPLNSIQERILAAQGLKSTANFKVKKNISIDTYERIKKENNTAKFDMVMAGLFIVPDFMVGKLLVKRVLIQAGHRMKSFIKLVSSSDDIKKMISAEQLKYKNMSLFRKTVKNTYNSLKLGHKTSLNMTADQVKDITFDTMRRSVRESKISYVEAKSLSHLSRDLKNMAHFIMDITKRSDLELVKMIGKGWIPWSKTKIGKVVKNGDELVEMLRAEDLTPETVKLLDQLTESLRRMEGMYIPSKEQVKLSKFGSINMLNGDQGKVVSNYFKTLDKIALANPSNLYSDRLGIFYQGKFNKLRSMKLKHFNGLVDVKKKQLKIYDDLLSGKYKNSDEAFDDWMKVVNTSGRDIKNIVNDLIVKRKPIEYVFEMFFESRWGSLGKYLKITPDSFLKSVYEDISKVIDIHENIRHVDSKSLARKITDRSKSLLGKLDEALFFVRDRLYI